MGADEARPVARYFIRGALKRLREGDFGKSWAAVERARPAIAEMRDPVATRLLKETVKVFHTKDHRRQRSKLAEFAEYLA